MLEFINKEIIDAKCTTAAAQDVNGKFRVYYTEQALVLKLKKTFLESEIIDFSRTCSMTKEK